MFDSREDTTTLDTTRDSTCQSNASIRIIKEALETPTVERAAHDGDRGPEPYVGALCLALAGQEKHGSLDKLRVPCSAHSGATGYAEGGHGIEEA